MPRYQIFIIRAILAAVFAVVLVRMFYPQKPMAYALGLAVFLIGLAYYFEHIRKNKKG